MSESAGKPFANTFKLEIEQSTALGLAEDAPQLVLNASIEKNGGLKPVLGLENGPFSCPP